MNERIKHGKLYSEWQALGADPSSKWFGSSKQRTKDCEDCPLKRIIDEVDWCMYGVGKLLSETLNERSCALIDENNAPRENWPNWKK